MNGVVVAGDDAGQDARRFAEAHGWPLLAEPTSGARTGTHAIRTHRLLLADPSLSSRIEKVVVFGHPTLSRPVTQLISRSDIEVAGVPGPLGLTDPGHVMREMESEVVLNPGVSRARATSTTEDDSPVEVRAERASRPSTAWLSEWQDRDHEVVAKLDALLDASDELLPHHVARTVARMLPEGGLLFVGASNPIRDLDLVAPSYGVGGRRRIIANRGLAGIDGSVSMAIGAALGRPQTTRAFALLGDVTFLHDSNGLLIGPDEQQPDIQIVVVNDDGGSIFSGLEQGDPAHAAGFEKLFGTPHGTNIEALCQAHGIPHWRARTRAELETALANPMGGIEVVEAVVRRNNRRELDAAIRALV